MAAIKKSTGAPKVKKGATTIREAKGNVPKMKNPPPPPPKKK
jgi:hypothetical protein